MRPVKQPISTPRIIYPGVRMLKSAYTTFEYTSRPTALISDCSNRIDSADADDGRTETKITNALECNAGGDVNDDVRVARAYLHNQPVEYKIVGRSDLSLFIPPTYIPTHHDQLRGKLQP